MNSDLRHRSAIAATGVALFLSASPLAAEPDSDRFKAEIETFVERLAPISGGVVRWVSSDPYEIQRDGEALLAVIDNAQLSVKTQNPGRLTLDRIEVRKSARKEDGNLTEYALALPNTINLIEADGGETKLVLTGANLHAVVEADTGRGREAAIEIAGVRIDQPDTGAWVSLGPLSISWRFVTEPSGGWSGPAEFEARGIEYYLPQGPVGGGIDRVAFSGRSSGPKIMALDELRDAIDRLRADKTGLPEARGATFLAALPMLPEPFSTIRGEVSLEGLAVRTMTGEALLAVAKARSTTEITGLDTDEAALRFSIRHDGLHLSPSLLEDAKVPRRVIFDIGLTGLSTRALSKLIQAVSAASGQQENGEGEGNKQTSIQQTLGAAAMLNPTFHVYEIVIDTKEVGINLSAEARGTPLAPKGYAASGDLAIRGFDAIPNLVDGALFAEYLPVLREIGVEATAQDGTSQLHFRLSSAPGKWITINGNDVSAWFDGTETSAGEPRLLRMSDPPMQGNDVKSVQRALSAEKIIVNQDGVYNSITAAAVARFQKEKGINVSGAVDAVTRRWLGGLDDPSRRGGQN